MKKYFFLFILLLPLWVGAAPYRAAFASPQDKAVYLSLLTEYPQEIKDFDQTQEPFEVVQAFIHDWQAFVEHGQEIPLKWFQGYSWSASLQEFAHFVPQVPQVTQDTDVELLTVNIDRSEHSITDPELYAKQRIGSEIAETLKKFSVPTIIYAGTPDSLASYLKISSNDLHFLPSPYEAWGLHKIFVPGSAFTDGKARFVMTIPPSRQYLIHYAQMFQYLSIPVEKAVLNHQDQKNQVSLLENAFRKLRPQLPTSPDVIVLGYYDQFQNNADFKKLTGEISMGQGLTVQMLQDSRGARPFHYLLMKSDLTIWGESSAFLVKASLTLEPRAVLFMGSAGGINTNTSVYDLSVPSRFVLDDKTLPMPNEVYENAVSLKDIPSGIFLGALHGHTNSPIEQSKDYVTQRVRQGIDSYDVEQNLIADTILEHNNEKQMHVLFGAINLITDKPKSTLFDWQHAYNLDLINKNQKSLARKKAVALAIEAFHRSPLLRQIECSRIFAY